MLYSPREEMLFELLARIFRDTPPDRADAIAIYGQTVENENSMLECAANHWLKNGARLIAVTGFGDANQGEFQVSSSHSYR